MRRRGLLATAVAAASLAAAALCCAGAAAQEPTLEYAVKATYLYKFAPFVEWPGGAAAGPLELCVVGDDPFGGLLDRAVADQAVGGRRIAVRRLELARSAEGCEILYLAGSPAQSVAEALRALRGEPALTVTDAAADPASKGVIHFVVVDNRVRFEIDAEAAAASGLRISSKLLELAVTVRRRS